MLGSDFFFEVLIVSRLQTLFAFTRNLFFVPALIGHAFSELFFGCSHRVSLRDSEGSLSLFHLNSA